MQKSISFLLSINKQVKFEIKRTIAFYIPLAPSNNEFFRNKSKKFRKYIENLYEKTMKPMNEIKELNNCRDNLCSLIGRFNIVRYQFFLT